MSPSILVDGSNRVIAVVGASKFVSYRRLFHFYNSLMLANEPYKI